ncbi:hypothetical protein ART_2580 [Arthrobacter sp. PAMC 25486]|nr:hypothetical protein ART_2580 [Arthrobacter sp. PAMC 25486]
MRRRLSTAAEISEPLSAGPAGASLAAVLAARSQLTMEWGAGVVAVGLVCGLMITSDHRSLNTRWRPAQ